MGYSQALSGLGSASDELDTIGNNIANSSTVGFKSGTTLFADMYANTVSTGVTSDQGIGVRTVGVQQNFGEGSFTSTGSATDLAINGNGFFQLSANGVTEYSRNGQFHVDPNGYIINAEGANLTGYPTSTGGVVTTMIPQPLQINEGSMAPSASTTITSGGINLDSSLGVPSVTPFSPTNSNSYTYVAQTQTYDSLGNKHDVNMYFVRDPQPTPPVTPATVNFSVYATEDGTLITPPAPATTAGLVGDMQFSSSGTLVQFSDANGNVSATTPDTVSMTLTSSTGSNTPLPISVNFQGATAFAGVGNAAAAIADGYPAGNYDGVQIESDGTVEATYTNNKTVTFGKVVLANFINPNGLKNVGNNAWTATADSGPAEVGTPGTGPLGALLPGELEESNVDLTANLVDLITAQRFYQANAQTVKTQNAVDQTLLNMN
ncbi:Flagellar hook protein FlgE [Pararobbsia alpina]|uniref:flagellar hook protein FlgE n=1 Tax=Pararobbsia alpina TaxID=621374 RepID=UPI0039A454D4